MVKINEINIWEQEKKTTWFKIKSEKYDTAIKTVKDPITM